jgi:alpha-galactosidase
MNLISSHTVSGDILLRYLQDPVSGRVGWLLAPAAMEYAVVEPRGGLAGLPFIDAIPDAGNPPARPLDPLAQVKILGDPYPGAFAQGHTMRNSPSVDRFQLANHEVKTDGARTLIVTTLASQENYRLEHLVSWRAGDAAFQVQTIFHNDSPLPVILEMLGSFSLGNLLPFAADDAPGRLLTHRFRSAWSAEGRLETRSIEELHLERSWSGAGMFSERFGQVGSMPVRRWFPFAAIEDTAADVVWGAQLAWAGSWQMEFFRQHDDVCLSGGLADREFGHWLKMLAPGEQLASPSAAITCVKGSLDELCDRLTALQNFSVDQQPAVEQDLPIVFNEWCTTWGDPQHDKVLAIADRLQGTEAKYLVIDAGWFKQGNAGWEYGHGDWLPNKKLFPAGLAATARAIRERGLIPGLWFEMETCGHDSEAFHRTDLLLKRDGLPLTVRGRRFWDLNNPTTIDYLSARVIDLLESGGFDYLKVDYNETIGLGADHDNGVGEGLRRQIEGVYRFFQKIREHLPLLVIENCASGGHRLEPSMLALTAMSSFSDAHELPEIPLIAANLHRLILPRQLQIWAVLHPSDSMQRLAYSLAATLLGRMCLSGNIINLSPEQWRFVQRAQQFYRAAAPIIKHGTSRRLGNIGSSWRHPQGWQAIRRLSPDSQQALIVIHGFAQTPSQLEIPLPAGNWKITAQFDDGQSVITQTPQKLICQFVSDFSACALLIESSQELSKAANNTK